MNTETLNGAVLGSAVPAAPADALPSTFDSDLVVAPDADPFAIDPRFTTVTDT